jgi:hypothetical protein
VVIKATRAKIPTTGPTIAPIGVDLCGEAVVVGGGLDEAEVEVLEVEEDGGLGVTRI